MVIAGHDPRAVANEMIEHSLNQSTHLPNVSIQKLLYFAHASYLQRKGIPLVATVFEAWEYGPVCRSVYNELKHHGRETVNSRIQNVDIFTGEVSELTLQNDEQARAHVTNVMETYGRLSPGQLIELSHAKNGPWHYVWHKARTGTTIGNTIHDIVIKERFYHHMRPVRPARIGETDEAAPPSGD